MGFNGVGDVLSGPHGHKISKYPVRGFNKGILLDIVSQSLSTPSEDYLPFLLQNEGIVYYEMEYKGLVVVIPHPAKGVPPNIKTVAVIPKYQKNYVGSDLMHVVMEEFPKSNLRSRPIPERERANRMYRRFFGNPRKFQNVEGIDYNGYFRGHSRLEIKEATSYMAQQPDAFKKEALDSVL